MGFSFHASNRLFLYTPCRCVVADAVRLKEGLRGRFPAGEAGWGTPSGETFGSANQFSLSDQIVINEIYYNPADEAVADLEPVGGEVDLRVHEVMASDEPGRSAPETDAADAYQLGGDEADLEPVVRDAVLLALPLSPLCADDCVGPDPEWLPSADSPAETEDGPAGDPRWAALDVLRFDEPDLG